MNQDSIRTPNLTRRELLGTGAAAAAGLALGPALVFARRSDEKSLVLYCSADEDVAQPVIDGFTKATGISVKPVYDTEATKTTGLVNRLLGEKGRPRADVWWSSEAFGTIRLSRAGALEPYTSAAAEKQMTDEHGWPEYLRGKDKTWYGFGSRGRVIVYNTKIFRNGPTAEILIDLADSQYKGRIGMAKPEFGTTRGHMAAYASRLSETSLQKSLRRLKENGLRLFDGNAGVARAVGTGEIHIGLTDTDDVFEGKKQGWPIEMRFETNTPRNMFGADGGWQASGLGPLFFPNTVAKVKGATNPDGAEKFIDHVLSLPVQRAMAMADGHNIPVDSALRQEFCMWAKGGPQMNPFDYEKVADSMDGAMKVCADVFG